MKKVYPVIFTPDEDFILVEVPDMEIFTQGETLVDAMEMARDAIGLKGIAMEDADEVLPEASAWQEISLENSNFFEAGKTFVSLIDVDFTEYRKKVDNKMVRRNVTLPNWMNVAAEKAGLNVSKVLQEALKERLTV